MGLPDFMDLDEVIIPPSDQFELKWKIDEKLYLNSEKPKPTEVTLPDMAKMNATHSTMRTATTPGQEY